MAASKAKAKPPKSGKPASASNRVAPDPVAASSARELGKLVGRSHTAVNRWLRDERWPFGPGPWKASAIAPILQWIEAELVERPATAELRGSESRGISAEPRSSMGLDDLSITKKADVALKIKRREVLDFSLQVQQGKYHLVDVCQQRMLRAIHEVRQGLLNLPDAIPADADTKAIIKGRVIELLRRFRSGLGVTADLGVKAEDVGGS